MADQKRISLCSTELFFSTTVGWFLLHYDQVVVIIMYFQTLNAHITLHTPFGGMSPIRRGTFIFIEQILLYLKVM